MFTEAIGIVIFGVFIFRGWASMQLWYRALLTCAVSSAVAGWFYQLSGSEIIEFDAQKLSISKDILGWNRTSEYSINDCSQLEWRETTSGEGDVNGLQCKVGWRTLKFAQYISEDEAIEVLTALQTNLPDVAQRICEMQDTIKKHFTTLNLG